MVPRTLTTVALVAMLGCRESPEPPANPAGTSKPSKPSKPPAPSTSPVAVAASLEVVAVLDRQIDERLAFGRDGRWWHWDGTEATEFHDGVRHEPALREEQLRALEPAVPPGRALVLGKSLLTPGGLRPLPGDLGDAFELHPMAHGGYERIALAWSPDASLVAIARRLRPSGCCGGESDSGPAPSRDVVDLYDTRTGEHRRRPGEPPLALSSDRLLAGSRLYALPDLRPLDAPVPEPPHAVAVDPRGELIASAGANDELRLLRAADGATLRTWSGPQTIAALAFHPRVPLLAVATESRIELWRIDPETPERLADAPLPTAPHALVFEPAGPRLVATGFRPVLLRVTLDQQPGPELTPLRRALSAR